MTKNEIINAYVRIRKIDNTIPDDILNFMKEAALKAIDAEGTPAVANIAIEQAMVKYPEKALRVSSSTRWMVFEESTTDWEVYDHPPRGGVKLIGKSGLSNAVKLLLGIEDESIKTD